jgi:hypothetical protein
MADGNALFVDGPGGEQGYHWFVRSLDGTVRSVHTTEEVAKRAAQGPPVDLFP